jgi:hypothetical protein
VPAEAVWAGGADGGAWIHCTEEGTGNRNSCVVFDDITGRVLVRGDFVLKGMQHGVPVRDLRYGGFDGQDILLMDGRSLTPVRTNQRLE